jgi:hypothetical protein
MRHEHLAKPKFLVPLVFLLWLVVSLPLSVSQAGEVSDPACLPAGQETAGVWGQPDDPYYEGGSAHLTPISSCYRVGNLDSGGRPDGSAILTWGEWWRDKPEDCDLSTPETAYATCSDSDMNWYIRLNRAERTAAGITSGEIKKIQRWGQCKKSGQRDSSKWCNFLTETIPQGGNYGALDPANYDGDPTNDQPQLENPCIDRDWGVPRREWVSNDPCKNKDIRISFTGTRVKDNNHGWKEVHPVRKEVWTEGTRTRTCALDQNHQPSCT